MGITPLATAAFRTDKVDDVYYVNNDYVYPGYTQPPILDPVFLGSNGISYDNNPFRNIGLLRGWIFPVDADAALHAAAAAGVVGGTDVEAALEEATAEERARLEDPDAVAEATQTGSYSVSGITVPIYEAARPVGVPQVLMQTGVKVTTPTKIRYGEGKQFQFNPFALDLSIGMTAAAPEESGQQGGTASAQMVGQAESSLKLYFDRSIEVAAATNGRTHVQGHRIDPIFADVGVQKDLWDVFRMIIGGDPGYFNTIGKEYTNLHDLVGQEIRAGSGTDMNIRLFDLGLSGNKAWARRVAFYFNPNLVILGEPTRLGMVYAEFNANYVPTKAVLDIGLLIMSTTTESAASALTLADTSDVTTEDPDTGGPTESASTTRPPLRLVSGDPASGNAVYSNGGPLMMV